MTNEITQPTFIEQELQKFDVVEAKLIELASNGKGLKIASPEDRIGIEAVKKARIAIKNERVRIEKKGKELRDQATKFNKAVLAKEKEYLAIIVPTEDELMAEEKRIADEQARIDREIVEAKQKRTYERLNALSAVGFVIDYSRAEAMTDEVFNHELAEATAQFQAEQKRLAEQKEAQRIEAERLAAEKLAMEAERINQAAKQRELELAAQKVRLEQEAVERERKQQIEHQEQLRLAAERAEKDKIAAAEKAEANRLAAIEAERLRIEKEISDKAEAKKQADLKAKRKADLAPDKVKLTELAKSLDTYQLPKLKMAEAEEVINNVRSLLGKVSTYINQQIEKL